MFDGTFRNNSPFFFFGIIISNRIAATLLLPFPSRIKTSFRKNITDDSIIFLQKMNAQETPKSYIWKKPKTNIE